MVENAPKPQELITQSTPPSAGEELSATAKSKLAAAVRVEKKRLEKEFEARVSICKSSKRIHEKIIPHYEKERKEAQDIIKHRKGVFTREQFRRLLSLLHPDTIMDVERKPKYEEMFLLVKRLEHVLVKPEPVERKSSGTLPTTVSELNAAREAFAAKRKG